MPHSVQVAAYLRLAEAHKDFEPIKMAAEAARDVRTLRLRRMKRPVSSF